MNIIKKNLDKVLVLVLALALITSSIGALAYNAGTNDAKNDTTAQSENNNNEKKKESKISKDETVYVMTKADGSVKKIIVSDWIKNSLNKQTIEDQSNLDNIKNVKGDEKYTMNSENMRVWDAQGNDIYYQGTIEKELPVDVAVSYKLDGQTISPDELAGKSGRVSMRFDYTNKQYEYCEIDGKQEKIYVPYVMLTGTILDNDTFTNINITNGKIINDGDRTFVVGFALPGMQQSLNVSKSNMEIPDYVEISADVTDFELTTTLSLATNEMFNEIDTSKADSIDELTNSMDDLTDAMSKLIDGSSTLYQGVSTLLDKSGQLISGIDKLVDGANKIKNGTGTLKSGSQTLDNGLKDLYEGLSKLNAKNGDLNAAAKTVFNTLLSTADAQIKAAGLDIEKLTISNYSSVLDKAIASLDEDTIRAYATGVAKKTVTQQVEAQRDYIKSQVEIAVRQKVLEGVLSNLGYTYDQYKQAAAAGLIDTQTQSMIDAAVDTQMMTEEIQNKIKQSTDSKVNDLINENMKSDAVQNQIEAAVTQANSGATSLKSLKTQLCSYNEFYTGLATYTDGVESAYNGAGMLSGGAEALSSGTDTLADGAITLYNGLATLKGKSGQLVDGIEKLSNGAMQLSDGIKKFNTEGVEKLTDAVNGKLGNLYTRLKATIDVSKNYRSFAGIPDGLDGTTRFIYKTDAIEKANKNN